MLPCFIKHSSCFLVLFSIALTGHSQKKANREIYEIKTYRLSGAQQEKQVDVFLKDAFLPALHRQGIKEVGVFKPLETDSLYGKRIVLLIPYRSLQQFYDLPDLLLRDEVFNQAGKNYLEAVYDNPPYQRIETILLRAFSGSPKMEVPALTNARSERVYELRSYEGYTEKIYQNKVKMFNAGDEIGLFKRLGFNAVFYAEVLVGNHQPNLMYLTTFANQAARDEHWKLFVEDPHWKKLIAMPEYQHNLSKMTISFLRPIDYSDY
jgi:NIPSNAP